MQNDAWLLTFLTIQFSCTLIIANVFTIHGAIDCDLLYVTMSRQVSHLGGSLNTGIITAKLI